VLRSDGTAKRQKPTMVNAKLLKLVCADSEGKDLYEKYGKG
jgi:hypothetical protein